MVRNSPEMLFKALGSEGVCFEGRLAISYDQDSGSGVVVLFELPCINVERQGWCPSKQSSRFRFMQRYSPKIMIQRSKHVPGDSYVVPVWVVYSIPSKRTSHNQKE